MSKKREPCLPLPPVSHVRGALLALPLAAFAEKGTYGSLGCKSSSYLLNISSASCNCLLLFLSDSLIRSLTTGVECLPPAADVDEVEVEAEEPALLLLPMKEGGGGLTGEGLA